MNKTFNVKEQMVNGVKWRGIGQLTGYFIQFIVWIVLARTLPPNNFGSLSIALLFTNMAIIFNELGITTAIIQKKNVTKEHIITAFWTCLLIGSVILSMSILVSPIAATFFNNPGISSLIVIFFTKLFVDSSGMVNEALLRKKMLFKKLAFTEFFSSIIFGIVAISLSCKNFGIVSIAYGYLAKSIVKVFLLWCYCPFELSLKFYTSSFRDLFGFGKNIVGFKILSYISNNIDLALIGKFLGSTALGYYSLALNLVNFPRQKLSSVIGVVAFPAFSKVQEDMGSIKRGYLKIIRYISIISFPLLTGLIMVSYLFIPIVYSSKWDPAVLPLQILCIYGICFSITTFAGTIFNSTGHPEYSFKLSIVSLAGTIIAIISGVRYGLVGISVGLTIYAVFINIVANVIIGKLIKMKLIDYIRSIMPAMMASVTMVAVLSILIWGRSSMYGLSDMWFLVLMIITGVVSYFVVLCFISRESIDELKKIFKIMLNFRG